MGISLAFLTAFFITAKDVVSKRVSASVDGTVSTFASFVYALPFYLVALLSLWALGYEDFHLSPGFFGLVILRSISDAVAEWCKMSAFAYGELSTLSPFLSLTPLFLLPIAPYLTGDEITLRGSVGVAFVVVGCVLASRKNTQAPVSEGKTETRGYLFALGFSFFAALNTCLDRLAVHQASPTFSGFLMTLFAAIPFLPSMLRRRDRMSDLKVHWRPFTVRGLFEILFMVLKLSALKFLEAAYVAAIQRTSILLSIVTGHYFLREGHLQKRLGVGSLVLLGVLLILWR